MMDTVRQLLEQSPMLALFAAIGLGYALGQISISGFSLGVGAVLFTGLALGAIAPKSTPPGMVSSIGLVMFLYGIGIQYGRQFFAGLNGPGLKWNLIAALGVLGSLGVALALGKAVGASPAYSMGLFAGSLTNTPTLQAAIEAAGNRDPAIGYSVAYPFGVIGPILCLFAFSRMFKPRLEAAPAPLQPLEITLVGTQTVTVSELIATLPPGVELIAIRQGGENMLPEPQALVAAGDGVLLYGEPEALEKARIALGRVDPGRIARDRGALDVVRFFVSRAGLVGTSLGQVTFPDDIAAKIVEVRRGDAVLFPSADLVLEYGDRVGVVTPRESIPALRRHFGDSMKSTAEFSYVSVGLGMSLGVLLGLVDCSDPRRWFLLARARWRFTYRRADPWPAWKDRLTLLASAAVGQPHAAQFRADAVPCRRGPRLGRTLCRHGFQDGPYVPVDRRSHPACRCCGRHAARAVRVQPVDRRSLRNRVGSHRQSGDPRLCKPGGTKRPHRCFLRNHLPFHDDPEDHLRSGRHQHTRSRVTREIPNGLT